MILVDTSVWVDHLRRPDPLLFSLLGANRVLMHPFILGELAMGDLRPRDATLRSLRRLPEMIPARHSEVLALVDQERLYATGIGYVDAHLLASARLTPGASIWTRDRKLAAVAEQLSLAGQPHDA